MRSIKCPRPYTVLTALSSSLLQVLFWLSVCQQQRMLMHCKPDWTTSCEVSRAGSASIRLPHKRGRCLCQAAAAGRKAACHSGFITEAHEVTKENKSTHLSTSKLTVKRGNHIETYLELYVPESKEGGK